MTLVGFTCPSVCNEVGAEGAWSDGSDYFKTADVVKSGYCWLEEGEKDEQIMIIWTDDNDYETGYEIERSVNGGGYADLVTKEADTTSHADTDVVSGNTYQYRIRTVIGDDYSNWCTTAELSLATGGFKFEGFKFEDIIFR